MQRLVAGVDVDLAEVRVRLGVDAAGPHEVHAPGRSRRPAARSGGPRGSTRRTPGSTRGPGSRSANPPLVNARTRFSVDADWWYACTSRSGSGMRAASLEAGAVDDVAAERRQLDVADALGGARAGLGELPGDAADLHDRHAHRVRQHDRHLQDDAQLLPDVVGGELLEATRRSRRPAAGTRCRRRPRPATPAASGPRRRTPAADTRRSSSAPDRARPRRATRVAGRRGGAATTTVSTPVGSTVMA